MKKVILIGVGLIGFLVLGFIVMAVFRLCPPIESGPQPPWCVNEERWETDMGALDDFAKGVKKDLGGLEYADEDPYVPKLLDMSDFPKKEYSVDFGVGPADFYWTVCVEGDCITPREQVYSVASRTKSLDNSFLYITDFIRFDGDLDMYTDSTALDQEEVDELIGVADEYGLYTIFVTNPYVSDMTVRHSDAGFNEDATYGGTYDEIFEYYKPSAKTVNKYYDEWSEEIAEHKKLYGDADYFVINPGNIFSTERELQNTRLKKLIVDNPGSCVMFNLGDVDGMDFYESADCIVVSMGFIEKWIGGSEQDPEVIAEKFDKFFEHPIFDLDKDIFFQIMFFSYDGAIDGGWFETSDYERLGLDFDVDYEEQAVVYDGILRSIYRNEPNLKGVFTYGYWWSSEMSPMRIDLSNSIRGKTAEDVWYNWAQVMG